MTTTNHVVAKMVRVENDPESGKLYIVFEIVDEKFKRKIINDFGTDVDLELDGKELKEV